MKVYDEPPPVEIERPMTPIVQLHSHPKWFYILLAVCAVALTVSVVDRELAYCPAIAESK